MDSVDQYRVPSTSNTAVAAYSMVLVDHEEYSTSHGTDLRSRQHFQATALYLCTILPSVYQVQNGTSIFSSVKKRGRQYCGTKLILFDESTSVPNTIELY